ncbi:cupin domain-containing protein [Nocardia sp. NPDC005746]|uniref:cupin domain-containing protein n=1 Tax=Nocardia sp. NPDC005746 TaxID=3157062 RepID=UPI0033C816B9
MRLDRNGPAFAVFVGPSERPIGGAIGGISESLNTGDSIFFRADADHGFANRTNAPCEYIMIISRRS